MDPLSGTEIEASRDDSGIPERRSDDALAFDLSRRKCFTTFSPIPRVLDFLGLTDDGRLFFRLRIDTEYRVLSTVHRALTVVQAMRLKLPLRKNLGLLRTVDRMNKQSGETSGLAAGVSKRIDGVASSRRRSSFDLFRPRSKCLELNAASHGAARAGGTAH